MGTTGAIAMWEFRRIIFLSISKPILQLRTGGTISDGTLPSWRLMQAVLKFGSPTASTRFGYRAVRSLPVYMRNLATEPASIFLRSPLGNTRLIQMRHQYCCMRIDV